MMKKLWLLPVLAISLAACGNSGDPEPADEDITVDTIEPEQEPAVESDTPAETDSESSTETEQPSSSGEELTAYEEAAVLEEHMPVDELTVRVETDNPGKRVLLFENQNGEKMYKSVFIKHDSHLKIIDLKDDQLLYEGTVSK